MKRKDLIKHLEKNGCLLKREGGSHTLYKNPENRKTSTVPRHKEVKNTLVKKICKDLGIEHPSGKWS